jgi:glycosyltransferase involved in cell wall biosynthesis
MTGSLADSDIMARPSSKIPAGSIAGVDVFVSSKNDRSGILAAKKNIERGGVPAKRIVVERSRPLSYSRYKIFQEAKTDYVVVFDDDVFIQNGWFETLARYFSFDDVVAVEGMVGYQGKPWLLKRGERSFGLWNTILRTDVFKKWFPEKWTYAYDDYLIGQFSLGFGKWVRVPVPGSHQFDMKRSAVWGGIGIREVFGVRSVVNMAKLAGMTAVYAKRKNRYGIEQNLLTIKGIMTGENKR